MISGAPNQPGMNSVMPPSSWARPMVATVSTSRGALAKRRMTKRSVSGAHQHAEADAEHGGDGHGTPLPRVSAAARPPPTPPMAP